jgi:hypothetical protein
MLVPNLTWAASKPDAWDNLKQLQPGQMIEILDVRLKTYRGRFSALGDTSITLHAGKSDATVSRSDVARVSIRDTSRRSHNMLIGAAVGVGAGLGLGLMWKSNCDLTGRCKAGAGSYAVIGGLVAAGTGLGAIPGHYRTIYRIPKPTDPVSPLYNRKY